MDCTYKGVGRREGWGGWWADGGRLYLPTGLLEHPLIQEVLVVSPDKPRGPTKCLTNRRVNIRPIAPIKCPPWVPIISVMISHDLQKPALEEQTSQLSLLMQQYVNSVWVCLSAGPIKWNRPSVTFWSVFSISSHIFRILSHEYWLWVYLCTNMHLTVPEMLLLYLQWYYICTYQCLK